MTDLRKLAKGQECQVRLPGICNGNSETTVLAHYRMAGVSGMGMKSPDVIAAWACSACHLAVDTDRAYRADFAEAVFRTQAKLVNLGVLRW